MVSKSLFFLLAQALLIKVVFGQCTCNSNLVLNNGINTISTIPAANIGCNGNLGLANINGLSSNLLSQQVLESLSNGGALSVTSGSNVSPNGLSVVADNLVVEGPIGVTGNMPLSGAISVDGNLASGGQASVSYTAGNGVGLTDVGCGAGLAGNALNINNNLNLAGLNGVNLAGLNNVNLAGLNGANLAGLNGANLAGLNGLRAGNLAGINGINVGGLRSCGCF